MRPARQHSYSSPKRSRGFTLLEVVVALAVLALTLGAVYEALGWSLRRSAIVQKKEIAWLQAQSILATLRAQPASLSGQRQGTQEGGSESVKWRVEVRERASAVSESSGIVPLDVTIIMPWGPKPNQEIELHSIELARRSP